MQPFSEGRAEVEGGGGGLAEGTEGVESKEEICIRLCNLRCSLE